MKNSKDASLLRDLINGHCANDRRRQKEPWLQARTPKNNLPHRMKPTGNELIDYCIKKAMGEDEKILLADGLESAFMGVGRQFTHPIAIYSYKKVIKILMRDHKMDREEAIEYFDYNIAGAFVGDQTPVFLQDE